MSKHPTSDLSPRDMACIEYGKLVGEFEEEFGWLPNPFLWDGDSRAMKRVFLKDLREARERIFRSCYNCKLLCRIGKDFACSIDEDYMIWHHERACTCPHYEKRGEI